MSTTISSEEFVRRCTGPATNRYWWVFARDSSILTDAALVPVGEPCRPGDIFSGPDSTEVMLSPNAQFRTVTHRWDNCVYRLSESLRRQLLLNLTGSAEGNPGTAEDRMPATPKNLRFRSTNSRPLPLP